jgi:hypothetical protein
LGSQVSDTFGGVGDWIKGKLGFGNKKAGGGWIGGRGFDQTPIMANHGEFLVSSPRAQNAQMPKILEAVNSGQLTSYDILAGLNGTVGNIRSSGGPTGLGAVTSGLAKSSTNNSTVVTKFGDIIINNPKPERASESIQRRVQALTV